MKSDFNSIWITANAGSGKTTALTARVVRLLLLGVVPERICCITYTKAAASEMRARVLKTLRSLLLAEEADCRAKVTELLGQAPSPEQMQRARLLFGQVLDSPQGGITLTTIHGFCQNILRRFPLEAEVPPHFTVLEEGAAERLQQRVLHRLLASMPTGHAALDDALALLSDRSSETRFEDILRDVIAKQAHWKALWRVNSPESLHAAMYVSHGLDDKATEAGIHEALGALLTLDDEAMFRAHLPALLNHKNKTEQKIGAIMADWLVADASGRAAQRDAVLGIFLTNEDQPRKQILSKDFANTPLDARCRKLADNAYRLVQQRQALACAQESYALALVAQSYLDLYDQEKAAQHALDYDDLISKTRALLSSSQMLGWVMSKLDHRIDHLLIDEAQDTSAEQWGIAGALVEELIAATGGFGSGNVPRSLLVVGDEKQSIYSFQGAAPELFTAKRTAFTALLSESAAPLRNEVLATSYRTAEAVLKLVDTLATDERIRPALSAIGEVQPHALHRADAPGLVRLYPATPAPEKEDVPPLTIPLEYLITQSAAQTLAEQVAATVAGWLKAGRMLPSEGRALRAGDVLILVRNRTTVVLPLIRALQRAGLPVAGLDRLTLADHLAVRDILALMRWCVNRADDLALAQVLRSPIIGMSDDALRAIAHGRVGSLWEALLSSTLAEESKLLQRLLTHRNASPYDFLTRLLEVEGTRQRFAERFGDEVHEVLDELKILAASLKGEEVPSIAHFVEAVAGSSKQIKREQEGGEADQIRIMTVHGAKGLEAPLVLLVDTTSVPTTGKEITYLVRDAHGRMLPGLALSPDAKRAPMFETAKEAKKTALLAEYYRLLYVATTRARDELHVFGIADKKGAVKEDCWYALLRDALRALDAVDEEGVLTLRDVRTPNSAPAGESKAASQVLVGGSKLPAWATTPPQTALRTTRPLAPSQLMQRAAPSIHATAPRGAAERGVRMHRVLELLDAGSDKNYIQRLIAHIAPDWDAPTQAKTVQEIHALFTEHHWLWQHPRHAEASICGTIEVNGTALPLQGQMDLLVETPERIVLLDYKTGNHIPQAQDVSPNYLLQLKAYRTLLAQLYPSKPIACAILWTAGPQLMWLDAAVEAMAWPELAAA